MGRTKNNNKGKNKSSLQRNWRRWFVWWNAI